MTDPRTDLELIAAHRAGDRHALGVLLERHRRLVCSIAYDVLHDVTAAEDVAQDIALRVVRHIDGWQARAKYTTWLHTITLRHAITVLRGRNRHALPADTSDLGDHLVPVAEDHADAAAARIDLGALLERLPLEQRQAVRALDLDGLTPRAVQAFTGVHRRTVSSRASRGRSELRRLTQGVPA